MPTNRNLRSVAAGLISLAITIAAVLLFPETAPRRAAFVAAVVPTSIATTSLPPPPPPTTLRHRPPRADRAARPAPGPNPGCATGSANPRFAPRANCSGCESRGIQTFDRAGKYWGKYQFDRPTWRAHGGDPAAYGSASEADQDAVAARVNYDAWPNC